ncbi:hypothetical protein EZS27_000011 [termite gut metagenome]|uniref:Calcium-binding protein P n=1 Tax=termite gut metagenome TaxID=433724 RepID=A0A5J4T223_9ZZZZ
MPTNLFMKTVLNNPLFIMITACLVGTGISSCAGEPDCSIAGRSLLRCYIYTYNSESKTIDKAALTQLTVTALETDSVIINAQTNVQDMSLPLRYTKETTVFVLHYNNSNEVTDTITINHRNTSYFLSLECGYEMKQNVTNVKYTKHLLDSISVRSNNTNVNGQENFQLFYN